MAGDCFVVPAKSRRDSSQRQITIRMNTYQFKPDIASHLAIQWPDVWEPLRIEFARFSIQCVNDLGTPPLVITCLGRTPAENASVGGIAKSLHLTNPCRAIDIRRRGFDRYAERMKLLWQSRGDGWDFVIEGPPFNPKPPHFHLEVDWRVRDYSTNNT